MAKKKAAQRKRPNATERKMSLVEFQRRRRFYLRSPEVSYQHACDVMERHRTELMSKQNVIGLDVGMKLQGVASTREFSVWVYVDRKLDSDETARLPKGDRIPDYLEDVPTDVQCPEFEQAVSRVSPGGTEISPKTEPNPGTLGFDVISHEDGRVRMLTCAHVVSTSQQVNKKTEKVVHATGDSLGHVHATQGVTWEFSDLLDCALIKPANPGLKRVGIPSGPSQPIRLRHAIPADVSSELPVWKLGAKTGLTQNGIVINHSSSSFPIRLADGSVMSVRNHVLIKPRIANGRSTAAFAERGDSGAIVCIDDEAIGILRAVDSKNGIVAAAPIVNASASLDFGI